MKGAETASDNGLEARLRGFARMEDVGVVSYNGVEARLRRIRDEGRRWKRRMAMAWVGLALAFPLGSVLMAFNEFTAFMVMGAAIVVAPMTLFGYCSRELGRLDRLVSQVLNDEYRGTAWKTEAGAVGIVNEVLANGTVFRLAFPSGAVETYEKGSLERMPGLASA